MSDEQNYSTVLTRSAIQGAQTFALLSPPLLLARAAWRRSFRLSTFLRSLTLSTLAAGPVVGAAVAAVRMAALHGAEVHDWALKIKADRTQRRVDDYSTIGAVLGALGTTTVLLRRAPLPWVVGAGASFGIAGGVLAHLVQGVQEERPGPAVAAEVRSALGGKGN
ncbi:hypothetical protein JCM1841_001966 [Sporobolomyces salmonicolor]